MRENQRKSCVILALLAVTISFSNGYHIDSDTPGSASASFSGSSASSSSFSSSNSNSFSGSINGNLGTQQFEKLVDGLKNGAAATALAGSSAGAIAGSHSGAGISCSGGCSGGEGSPESQNSGSYDAKHSATNQNAKVYSGSSNINSNVIPGSSGSCESCKGPFPGPSGSIHDYKLVSDIKSNSIAPSPTPTAPAVPHVSVPLVHNLVVSQFPGSPGSIFDGKPASSVPSVPSIHPGIPIQSGAQAGVTHGYQGSHNQQDTFAGVAIHKGTSLSPEFIEKLPGAPGTIHDSIIPTGSQATASAVGGIGYHLGSTGSNPNVGVSNIPTKHPLVGPACSWTPGSPPGGCGHAPEIIVPAPNPSVPSPAQPIGSSLGVVGKPDYHLFPGPTGSIHDSKPVSSSSVNIAGSQASANAGAHAQTGHHQVNLPTPTSSFHIGIFPEPTASTSGSNVYQPGTTNTGAYSEYDLPNQGVYYVNKDTQTPSLADDLQAPYQHPQAPSFSAQTPCHEDDSTCGHVKPINEPAHATERAPTCTGSHCDGQAQPIPPVINIGPSSGPKPFSEAHVSSGAETSHAGSTYTGTTQGVQVTNYKPFPSPNCINGGACAGEYPKPHCENGVCGQPISGFVQGQNPVEHLNQQPSPEGCQGGSCGQPEGSSLNLQPISQGCQGGNCEERLTSGYATGQVLIQKQPDAAFQIIEQDQPQSAGCSTGNCDQFNKGQVSSQNQDSFNSQSSQGDSFSLQPICVGGSCHQPSTGFATGQVLIQNQDGISSAQNIASNKHESDSKLNIACQRNGLCGQPPGPGKGQLFVPSQNGQNNAPRTNGFATGQVYVHKSDGSKVEIVEDGNLGSSGQFGHQAQPESQGCTTTSCESNVAQGSQQNGGTGFATGQVIVHQNGGVNDITNSGGSSTYGASGSQEGDSYGCPGGSCATGGTYNQKGSYGTSGSHPSGQKYGCLSGSCSDFQPYGALVGSKFHGSGSYASSGAFAHSGSLGGPLSHSLGLSRLTHGSSAHGGALSGSFSKAGSYGGAGSSAGAFASASAGSFASSY